MEGLDGNLLGLFDLGLVVGLVVGEIVGVSLGFCTGVMDGSTVGTAVGNFDGRIVGLIGALVGLIVFSSVGDAVGAPDEIILGTREGVDDDFSVGVLVDGPAFFLEGATDLLMEGSNVVGD